MKGLPEDESIGLGGRQKLPSLFFAQPMLVIRKNIRRDSRKGRRKKPKMQEKMQLKVYSFLDYLSDFFEHFRVAGAIH